MADSRRPEKAAAGSGRLAFAGILAIAVASGPARNGHGLFLPQIREELGLSTTLVGLIASAAKLVTADFSVADPGALAGA